MPQPLRLIAMLALCALLTVLPVFAQPPSSTAGWIPEDFAGFIRVDMANAQSTLEALNIATFVANVLQPTRVAFTGSQTFDAFFPLTALDLENAVFDDLVTGWLGNELIVAYPSLNEQFISEQPLLILPTRDAFRAVNDLSPVIQGQDFLERETMYGATVYHGDQVTIAFTPSVVLIGTPEDVEAALLTGIGESPSLIDQPSYQEITAALPEVSIVTAYLRNDSAANALNFVLNGGYGSEVVRALGEALDNPEEMASALSSGGVDAIGVSLNPITLFNSSIELNAVAHFADGVQAQIDPIDQTLLDFVPRNAMLVQAGGNGQKALQFALNALPMANFASVALGNFPLDPPTSSLQSVIPTPDASDVQTVIEDFSNLLGDTTGIDLNSLFEQFSGGYAAALLPRPNNPLPVLNSDVDGLFVAQVEDGSATLEQLRAIVEALTLQTLVEKPDSTQPIYVLQDPATGQSLLELTVIEDILVAGTGNAVDAALHAHSGDNRLTAEDRWQALTSEGIPQWYFDVDAIYNVASPSAGGPRSVPVNQVTIRQEELDDQLIRFILRASLSLT